MFTVHGFGKHLDDRRGLHSVLFRILKILKIPLQAFIKIISKCLEADPTSCMVSNCLQSYMAPLTREIVRFSLNIIVIIIRVFFTPFWYSLIYMREDAEQRASPEHLLISANRAEQI